MKIQAQPIPIWNGSFETWEHPKAFVYVPQNWTTLDSLINGYSTAEESSDAYAGNAALKLMPLRGTDPTKTRSSFAVLGKAKIDPSNLTVNDDLSGQPFNYQPQAITGHYKYLPNAVTGDSAYMYFICKYYDPLSLMRIAHGYYTFQPASVYQKFTIPIQSIGGNYPVDSIMIGIFYSSRDTGAVPSGYLLIDDIKAEGTLSVGTPVSVNALKVYPNPTADFVQIENAGLNSTIEIIDLAGRVLLQGRVEDEKVNVQQLPAGNYLLRVIGKEEIRVAEFQILR